MNDLMVSVIIPNYNGEKYIEGCIESVEHQTYKDLEVIIVDDGSHDLSKKIIEKYQKKYSNIKYYFQQNLGGSIARNKGIELANGKYFLFLDSDDILYPDAISIMIKKIIDTNADLVIGNFRKIDLNDNEIIKCEIVENESIVNDVYTLVGTIPNPTNKLYKADIIKNNMISWGNVKIGQDLNFYLKYLLYCKKIVTIPSIIYGWRVLKGSISNSYNFRILDITESFNNVKMFYSLHNAINIYNSYISTVEYRHYYLQLEKIIFFKDKRYRKIIFDYFNFMFDKIDLKESKNFELIKSDYVKCEIKRKFKYLYISNLYSKLYLKYKKI